MPLPLIPQTSGGCQGTLGINDVNHKFDSRVQVCAGRFEAEYGETLSPFGSIGIAEPIQRIDIPTMLCARKTQQKATCQKMIIKCVHTLRCQLASELETTECRRAEGRLKWRGKLNGRARGLTRAFLSWVDIKMSMKYIHWSKPARLPYGCREGAGGWRCCRYRGSPGSGLPGLGKHSSSRSVRHLAGLTLK